MLAHELEENRMPEAVKQQILAASQAEHRLNFNACALVHGVPTSPTPYRNEQLAAQTKEYRIGMYAARIISISVFTILTVALVSLALPSTAIAVGGIITGYLICRLTESAICLISGASPTNPKAWSRIRCVAWVGGAVTTLGAIGFMWLRLTDDPAVQRLIGPDLVLLETGLYLLAGAFASGVVLYAWAQTLTIKYQDVTHKLGAVRHRIDELRRKLDDDTIDNELHDLRR